MKLSNGPFHIAEFFFNKYISYPLLPHLAKTNITPNMITMTNILISPLTLYCAYKKYLLVVAFLMLLYQFFDNLDGNLARYKNLKSKLGAKLDETSDFIFYNFIFIFLGWNKVNVIAIILLVFLLNFYGYYATNYIVPRLKKLKIIKRRGIKKYFFDNGIILGIDVGTINVIVAIFAIIGFVKELYFLLIGLLILDIMYRTLELKYNENLTKNEKGVELND